MEGKGGVGGQYGLWERAGREHTWRDEGGTSKCLENVKGGQSPISAAFQNSWSGEDRVEGRVWRLDVVSEFNVGWVGVKGSGIQKNASGEGIRIHRQHAARVSKSPRERRRVQIAL